MATETVSQAEDFSHLAISFEPYTQRLEATNTLMAWIILARDILEEAREVALWSPEMQEALRKRNVALGSPEWAQRERDAFAWLAAQQHHAIHDLQEKLGLA